MIIPIISAVVPVYNAEGTISKCIESVLAQTFKEWELLLIIDGSLDKSYDICKKYASEDSRIKVFWQENSGPSRARNMGLSKIRGTYVTFIDSDDWIEDSAFEIYIRYAKTYHADIIKAGYIKEFCDRSVIVHSDKVDVYTEKWQMFGMSEAYQYCGFLWNTLFCRDLIGDLQFREDIKWCEDHLFSYEYFLKASLMVFIPEPLYHYCIRESVSLSNVSDPWLVMKVSLLELELKERLESGKDKETHEVILREFSGKINLAIKLLYKKGYGFKERYKFYYGICFKNIVHNTIEMKLFFEKRIPFCLRDILLKIRFMIAK